MEILELRAEIYDSSVAEATLMDETEYMSIQVCDTVEFVWNPNGNDVEKGVVVMVHDNPRKYTIYTGTSIGKYGRTQIRRVVSRPVSGVDPRVAELEGTVAKLKETIRLMCFELANYTQAVEKITGGAF